jgi:hypothetical protein
MQHFCKNQNEHRRVKEGFMVANDPKKNWNQVSSYEPIMSMSYWSSSTLNPSHDLETFKSRMTSTPMCIDV